MDALSSLIVLMVGNMWPWLIFGLVIGYLFGSIPFGLLLAHAAGHGDIRNIGSGNIGATNVLRTGNKGLAAATLLLDGLKATAAVALVNHWYGQVPAHMAALGAFLGHVFPVWLGFKGGKGVATYVGGLFGLTFGGGLAFCGIWLAVAYGMRISSLAALVASIATPVLLLIWGRPVTAAVFALLTVLLLWMHRANIGRLRAGTEPRIGEKAAAPAANAAQ